jgi:uncharacterized protein
MPIMPIDFADQGLIGQVTAVDTSRVYIRVDDHDLLRSVIVGNLVAVQGSNSDQFLIAIVDRISRLPGVPEPSGEDEDNSAVLQADAQDTMRVVLVGTYWKKYGDKGPLFKRGADCCPQIDQNCYLLQSGNLSAFMSTLSGDVEESSSLKIGQYIIDTAATAIADGDRFFQRHAAIVGSTGSGKSWTVAMLLERAAALDWPNIVVLDMHGEYASLAEGEHPIAARLRIAGPGDLSIPPSDALFLPYWLLNREEMLGMLLDRSDSNAPNQATIFTSEVRRLKEERLNSEGKSEVLATFTVDSPVPYDLVALIAEIKRLDTERVPGAREGTDKAGDWNGKLSRFLARLEAKSADRRYGFLFQVPAPTNEYEWLGALMKRLMDSSVQMPGIKVVDFSEVPGDVLPVVAGVFARLLYEVQFWMDPLKRTPICLVCDEAHLYLPVRDGADAAEKGALQAFERIAKEGRKYGVGLLVVSQRPSDVSRTILSQCNNFMALRLTNEQDQSAVRSVIPDAMVGITDVLPLLDIGEAIVLGDAVLLPSRVRLSEPTRKPKSLTRRFWYDWGSTAPSTEAIAAAVEAIRRQSRKVS